MKIKAIPVLLLLFTVACSKESSDKLQANAPGDAATAVLNLNVTPLNDLGTGTYKGSTGGLYPAGANSPSGQYATDLLSVSNNIIPIDTFGNASTKGKITFISLGGSTGGHTMRGLKDKTDSNALTNPNLLLLNCNDGYGSSSLNSIMNPNDTIWNHVTKIIKGAKSSYRQVQVIYLETDDSTTAVTWPARPNTVKTELESCLRTFRQKFKNIKVVYVLGRTRTFGPQRPWNMEPSPYYFGWGCKWAIEDQINGVPGTAYKGSNAVAPMITWGWYEWADVTPRKTDSFAWLPTETSDGLHANDRGIDTLSTRFQKFLLKDKYAKIWYAAH